MDLQALKNKITKLGRSHSELDEDGLGEIKSAEVLESEAQDLIIDYCVNKNYLVNGFPTLKEQMGEEYDEDYFSWKRYQLYLDLLTIEKSDVAALTWHYVSNFWPGWFDSKEEFIENIRHQINSSNFYDVDLE